MTDLKIGVVGIPGKWSTEVLADEIEKRTGFRLVIDIEKVVADLSIPEVLYQDQCLCKLDGIIIKKISQDYSPQVLDRLEILRFVECCGVKIYSNPAEILRLVDRMSCTVSLAKANIPMPKTLITEDVSAAYDAVHRFGSVVLKPLFSTKARGMEVLDSSTDKKTLQKQLKAYKEKHGFLYIQQKVQLPGHDMGLVFLGGEYQGAYARIGDGSSWNTTIHSGGKYAAVYPPDDVIEMARKAQAQFDLAYTTVDVAETEDGYICFEVSAFGGFKGAQEGLEINMASRYTDYVINLLLKDRNGELDAVS
ncbi:MULTISPECIES: GAK system ATP-grasp enzyme [Thiomicrorhabdus]|uniref:GAK system ATP-grasp enzyme n=1 Tax=Thiomicrorhabdus heinhorstiae TaxID=2748010 RepID=A0ABS0BVK1_9GAMM|nr:MULTISPECIES: GAK system ATP-grasp enzyme [Thiomicrorhabdus]MBF6057853.1 GAK system ATP-grasp enzyme [Thiomicrorhabdus heinhorstiae]